MFVEKGAEMAFRKLRAKKYSGIYEYYNPKSSDKETLAYYVQYRDEAGKVKKSKVPNAKDQDDALKYLNDQKAEVLKLKKEDASLKRDVSIRARHNKMTLDDLADLFFENRSTANNVKDKARYFNHVSGLAGRKKISALTIKDIEAIRDTLKETLAAKTVDNIIAQIRTMFRTGMKQSNRWCLSDPFEYERIGKLTNDLQSRRKRVFTDDELQTLFNELEYNPRIYLFTYLIYKTAARPEGILSLKQEDIDFNSKRISIKPMKGADGYTVPMTDEVQTKLRKWIKENSLQHGDYLFYPQSPALKLSDKERKRQKARYENFYRPVRTIMDRLFNKNIPTHDKKNRASLYTLRHTAATTLVRKFGIHSAKEYLNHSDIRITEIYAKIDDIRLQEMANAL